MARAVDVGEARTLCARLLESAGMPPDAARETADALVVAEVWGRSSHGLLRLPYYLERFAAGGSDPAAQLRLVKQSAATMAFDGGNGLGHWQLGRAAREAANLAVRTGVAAVSVANSGHAGMLGLGALPIVEADLFGLVFSTGPAAMPAVGGDRPVLSTSPIAAGVPGTPPAIVDLATSAVARGTIAARARAGATLEPGWAFDAAGEATTDPAAALAGMLAPLGGAKGFALAFLVEALTGGMVGPSLAPEIADPLAASAAGRPQRVAHLVIALNPGFLDVDGGARRRLGELSGSITASGGRVPGAAHPLPRDIGDDTRVSVPDALAEELAALAVARGVAPPPALVG